MNHLGEYLKKRLKEMKVSEREISSKCGISHSYLNQLIKGINPSTQKNISPTLSTFEKLSIGFGVSVDILQKIARGLVQEEDFFISDNKLHIDKIINTKNKNLSPDLLKQIHDFQHFMSLINFENLTKTEEDLSNLLYELQSVIRKHTRM